MSLRDPKRAQASFELHDAVRRALGSWSQEADPELARMNLKRALVRLDEAQRGQLIARLAEISLAQLFVLLREEK